MPGRCLRPQKTTRRVDRSFCCVRLATYNTVANQRASAVPTGIGAVRDVQRVQAVYEHCAGPAQHERHLLTDAQRRARPFPTPPRIRYRRRLRPQQRTRSLGHHPAACARWSTERHRLRRREHILSVRADSVVSSSVARRLVAVLAYHAVDGSNHGHYPA